MSVSRLIEFEGVTELGAQEHAVLIDVAGQGRPRGIGALHEEQVVNR